MIASPINRTLIYSMPKNIIITYNILSKAKKYKANCLK